jgi:hypothetical protein
MPITRREECFPLKAACPCRGTSATTRFCLCGQDMKEIEGVYSIAFPDRVVQPRDSSALAMVGLRATIRSARNTTALRSEATAGPSCFVSTCRAAGQHAVWNGAFAEGFA